MPATMQCCRRFVAVVVPCLPPTSAWTADICDNYCFPTHITPTDLRPDLVWWDDSQKTLCLAELTVCYDTNFAEAARRKSSKYEDLAGPTATTLPHSPSKWVHVGFRTMLASPQTAVITAALIGSFTIWCSRNRVL